MSRNRLRSRQRAFLSTRMKIAVGAAVSGLTIFLLVIYFNFFDVKDSKAFSSGDYRSVASGNWEDATVWEVYDGKEWNPALEPPGDGVRKILVTNGQKMVISDEIPINHLVIDEGSQVSIESNTIRISKFKNAGGITCHGILELGSTILEGNGDFLLGPTASLLIGSDAGIDKKGNTGNIQMTGKKDFNKDATYVFNGTVAQHTGNGIPVILKNLVIDNTSGVTLDQPMQILSRLQLNIGILNTSRHTLTLGNSSSAPCAIESDEGSFTGNIKVWYGLSNINQLQFPLSDGHNRYRVGFSCTQAVYQKGMIEFVYREGIPNDLQKSPFEARQVVVGITGKGHFSAMLSNGSEEAWLQLNSVKVTPGADAAINWDILKKSDVAVAGVVPAPNGKVKAVSNVLYGPVPFSSHLVVRFYSDFKTTTTMQMMSSKGKVVQMENINAMQGYNQFIFNATDKLTDGAYMIQISNSSEIHTFQVAREIITATKN